MKNIIIDDLCIEVTRKCNMNCQHCMRGEAQNISLDYNLIDTLFNNPELNIIAINRLIITGGEPTLNYKTVLEIIKKIMQKSISLKSFIMVTNGSNYNNELIDALNTFYQYKLSFNKNDTFDIICSLDQYHQQPKEEIIEKYKKLPYFKGNYKKLYYEDIICLGRAYLNHLGDINTYYLSKESLKYCLHSNYPTLYEENNTIFLKELYLSSKGLYGFYILDATYEMVDELCIYNNNELNNLINKNKVKRKH